LLDFPLAVTQILLGLMLLSFYHPAFIFFGMLLLLLLTLIFYVTGDKGFQTSLEKSNHKYDVAGWLEEMARVIRQFKFSAHHCLHEQKADGKVINYVEARKRHFSILLLQYKVLIGFKVIITAAMLIVGCFLLLEQQINIGQFVAAEIVIIIVINSVEKLIVNLDSVYSALTSVEKINKLLDKPVEKEGSFTTSQAGALKVALSNVSFAYHEERPVLSNISFTVNPGEKVCITGKDGSGKSTILKLLSGSYPAFSGSILVNDVPIGNYKLGYLRSQTGIALSQQDVFAGTLWENLVVGNDNIDMAYLSRLVQVTGLSQFIGSLKEGYDTVLSPTGNRLPKNVVQKILLVRAMVHKPKLLLLEEPCQGISEGSSREIQRFLMEEIDATVIIVTNEQALTSRSDQTIVL
jgi:ABC-type bacteriocin/lantibiotic exporter with double-glycine peptidase domain